jgi:hydrogenase maturation protease
MNACIHPPNVRALIIGYGNPLRGDDALGLRVADALAAIPEIAIDPFIRIETVHQLTPELAETIADAELVIFIDATAPFAGHAPGSLRCEEIGPAPQSIETLGHHLTPSQVLAYASALFGAKPSAFVASVTAASFDYGATLSPAVNAAIPALVLWARERIESGCVLA